MNNFNLIQAGYALEKTAADLRLEGLNGRLTATKARQNVYLRASKARKARKTVPLSINSVRELVRQRDSNVAKEYAKAIDEMRAAPKGIGLNSTQPNIIAGRKATNTAANINPPVDMSLKNIKKPPVPASAPAQGKGALNIAKEYMANKWKGLSKGKKIGVGSTALAAGTGIGAYFAGAFDGKKAPPPSMWNQVKTQISNNPMTSGALLGGAGLLGYGLSRRRRRRDDEED